MAYNHTYNYYPHDMGNIMIICGFDIIVWGNIYSPNYYPRDISKVMGHTY